MSRQRWCVLTAWYGCKKRNKLAKTTRRKQLQDSLKCKWAHKPYYKSVTAHIPTVTNYKLHAFASIFFLLKCSRTLSFWYTVRSQFSGSINCDSRFTGKCASESLCSQPHLSSARGRAIAAWGRATELMGTLILTPLSWKATQDESKHRKADRQDETEKKKEDREQKTTWDTKKAEKAESKYYRWTLQKWFQFIRNNMHLY